MLGNECEAPVVWALHKYMQRCLQEKPDAVAIFDGCFGPQSVLPLSKDLRELTVANMERVLDAKQAIPEDELEGELTTNNPRLGIVC